MTAPEDGHTTDADPGLEEASSSASPSPGAGDFREARPEDWAPGGRFAIKPRLEHHDASPGPLDELLARATAWHDSLPHDLYPDGLLGQYGIEPQLVADLAAALRSQITETGRLTEQNTALGVRVQQGWARAEELEAELAEARAETERLADSEQGWVDRAAYYRNTAIRAGAEPELFEDEYDQALARDDPGCCEIGARALRELAEARAAAPEPLWAGKTKPRRGFDPGETSFVERQLDVPAGTEVAVYRRGEGQ